MARLHRNTTRGYMPHERTDSPPAAPSAPNGRVVATATPHVRPHDRTHNPQASKEATLLAKLSHPNIVGFWESFFHGPSRDVLCIVMDYADGGDLSSCLRRRNGRLLDEEVVLDW